MVHQMLPNIESVLCIAGIAHLTHPLSGWGQKLLASLEAKSLHRMQITKVRRDMGKGIYLGVFGTKEKAWVNLP